MLTSVQSPESQKLLRRFVSEEELHRMSESLKESAKKLEAQWAEDDKHVTVKTTPEEQRDLARRVVAWEKECSRATREDFELRMKTAAKPEKKKNWLSFLIHPWRNEEKG